jgi:hypothetical protein
MTILHEEALLLIHIIFVWFFLCEACLVDGHLFDMGLYFSF